MKTREFHQERIWGSRRAHTSSQEFSKRGFGTKWRRQKERSGGGELANSLLERCEEW